MSPPCNMMSHRTGEELCRVPKAQFISYSRISYFGHACPKLNIVLISHLAGKLRVT